VQGAGKIAQHLKLQFEMGDKPLHMTLCICCKRIILYYVPLQGTHGERRRSKMGIERGREGKNRFRGSNDGAGHFKTLPEGHPLREHAHRARPRFRFAVFGSGLPLRSLIKRLLNYHTGSSVSTILSQACQLCIMFPSSGQCGFRIPVPKPCCSSSSVYGLWCGVGAVQCPGCSGGDTKNANGTVSQRRRRCGKSSSPMT
jgi:hypothetical protein